MSNPQSIGVYFSANDVVYDWAIAFLNSFRAFNPELRLILIPFNDECDRLLKLRDTYNFEVYVDSSFPRLEAIGQAFELGHTPTGPYWFRRYAAFWGPCDRFIYLDARQVILADLTPIFNALIGSSDEADDGFDLLHFDCAIHQVYEPGELRRKLLSKGKARGFNSGRWASHKGIFTLESFVQFASEALKIRDQLNARNTDQAFINYCCDIGSVRYGHAAEVLSGICHTAWARTSGKIYAENGKYYLWDYGGLDHKRQFLFLHWAGCALGSSIPNYSLFLRFRWPKQPLILRKILQGLENVKELPTRLLLSLRKSRRLSNLYHGTPKRDP